MKRCSFCRLDKPFTEFYRSASKSDGYQSRCISCNNSANVELYAKSATRREKVKNTRQGIKLKNKTLVDRYKRMCGCTHCGENDPIVLDLHHVDPSGKDASPASLLKGSLDVLRAEIRKCIVLCANCHRREHHRIRVNGEAVCTGLHR